MSVEYYRLIPTDPAYVPPDWARGLALSILRAALPQGTEITDEVRAEMTVWDAGELFEHIACPHCRAVIPQAWWIDAVEDAARWGFDDLSVETPCCGRASDLNGLAYHYPMGFARYGLEARDPDMANELEPAVVQSLETALGCRLRQCWARY